MNGVCVRIKYITYNIRAGSRRLSVKVTTQFSAAILLATPRNQLILLATHSTPSLPLPTHLNIQSCQLRENSDFDI